MTVSVTFDFVKRNGASQKRWYQSAAKETVMYLVGNCPSRRKSNPSYVKQFLQKKGSLVSLGLLPFTKSVERVSLEINKLKCVRINLL